MIVPQSQLTKKTKLNNNYHKEYHSLLSSYYVPGAALYSLCTCFVCLFVCLILTAMNRKCKHCLTHGCNSMMSAPLGLRVNSMSLYIQLHMCYDVLIKCPCGNR